MAPTLSSTLAPPDHRLAIAEACRRLPPLWPLQNFVAVNPFLGLSDLPFAEAAQLLEAVAHRAPFMDADYYLARLDDGSISARDVCVALEHSALPMQPDQPLAWLREQLQAPAITEHWLTVADWLDQAQGPVWSPFVIDEISKWCSSYFDRGQANWAMPWQDLPLYQAWKQAAQIDANPEVRGLPGFRRHVQQLPDSASEAIGVALDLLDLPSHQTADFLHRQLLSVIGWSAYAAYHDRLQPDSVTVLQLLAIRLAYDTALLPLAPGWSPKTSRRASTSGSVKAKHVAQSAFEHAFRSRLAAQLTVAPPPAPLAGRPALQAVFCIDVRSEVYRRALEAQSPGIATAGFAGFFGMPIEYASTARCPVLLSPRHQVHRANDLTAAHPWPKRVAAAWQALRNSATASFPAVEVAGPWFGLSLLQRLRRVPAAQPAAPELTWLIPLADRIDLAAGALKNMSLDPRQLAPVVLLCGHGSRTENNPYASSLDCGACGGHPGEINARFAAALFNDPAVRQGLQARGLALPADTVFVAGLHITTTDEVILYDAETLLSPTQRSQLEDWLLGASQQARRERSAAHLPTSSTVTSCELAREFERRSADWSEVRPEWGLARNAAFIAAPRARTQALDLAGRVFLHEYDSAADEDGSVLTLILTAPVVVASWINLQYYGSTVDNRLYGSGNKVLHNVVGTFGVWEGNGGDLRTGLPLQSLHQGDTWVHEPLRLHVVIDAPRHRLDQVLRAQPSLRQLVEHQWIHLLALEGTSLYACRSLSDWQSVDAASAR